MAPISLTPDQRRIIFDALKVRPLTPDQEPSTEHLDAYVAQSTADDPLAAQIRKLRETSFGTPGMGSIASHLGPTIPTSTSGPLLLQKTLESGTLILKNGNQLDARWFLLGFQGLYFLVSDVRDNQHEYSGPKIWPLDHRQKTILAEFISLFPTDKDSYREIEASPEAATRFVSLKRTLTENFQAKENPGNTGQFILDGIPINVHFSLIPKTKKLSDVRIELPGGADAARKLGLMVEETSHAAVAQAAFTQYKFKKIGDAQSLFSLTTYQAGPFVILHNQSTNVFEIYLNETDGAKSYKQQESLGGQFDDILKKGKIPETELPAMDEAVLLLVEDKQNHYRPVADLGAAKQREYLAIKSRMGDGPSNIDFSHQFPKDSIAIKKSGDEFMLEIRESDEVRKIFKGVYEKAQKSGTVPPNGSVKPDHPDIPHASLIKEDLLEIASKIQEWPLVYKGYVPSPNGNLKIYQAGPFVLTIPPHERKEIEIIELYRSQRDAQFLMASYFQREKSLVTLAAAKPNRLLVPISQLEGTAHKLASRAFRQMDLADYFQRQRQLRSAGISVRKKQDGTMTLEFKPSLDLLHLLHLVPGDLDESEIISALANGQNIQKPNTSLIGPRIDLFRLKINNPEPITICITQFGNFYFFFKEFANGTKSPLAPLKADSISELTHKIVNHFGKIIVKNGNIYEGELPVNEDITIKMLLYGHLIIEGHSPMEAFEQQQALSAAIEMVQHEGRDYLQILKPETLEKLGLIQTKRPTGPILLGPQQIVYQFQFPKQGSPLPTFYHYGNLWFYRLEGFQGYHPMLLRADRIDAVIKEVEDIVSHNHLKKIADHKYEANEANTGEVIDALKAVVDKYSYFSRNNIEQFDGPAIDALTTGIKTIKKGGEEFLEVRDPQALVKIGINLADLKFSQITTKLVVPDQKPFSKEWFEHFPKNQAAYFEMTDDAGNQLPCISFALTSAPHPLSAILNDGSNKIFGFIYWDIKNNSPHVYIQASRPGTLNQSIDDQIRATLATKDKLIADPSFYVTIASQLSNRILQVENTEADIGLIGPWTTKMSTENEKIKLKMAHYLAGSMQGLPQQDPAFSSEFIQILEIPNSIGKKQTKKEAGLSPNWFHSRNMIDTDVVYFYDTKVQILRTQDQNSFALLIADEGSVDFAVLTTNNEAQKQLAAIKSFLQMLDQTRQANKQLFIQTSFNRMGAASSLELNWHDETSGQEHSLQFRTAALKPNINFGASFLGQSVEIANWRIAGETIVPTNGLGQKYFLKKEAPSNITKTSEQPVKIEPQPEIPKPSATLKFIQEEIATLNLARKGLRNLPLDFANWALKKFDALT
ncbi:MAG: hypothetical protein ACD_73C00428G0002, partial [uncultured bacterium]